MEVRDRWWCGFLKVPGVRFQVREERMRLSRKERVGVRQALLLTVVFALILGTVSGQSVRKFYNDDPMAVAPETKDASKVANFKIDLFYDLMLNQFAKPGEPAGPRAKNINTIDEVPDSSWFTNRILEKGVSVAEAVQGATTGKGPAPGKWVVIRAKTEGAAPGFTIRDGAGETWFLAFDPNSNPEGATAAAVVASRIFWTLGYFQAEYYISELRPNQLSVDPKATYTPPSKRERPMKLSDVLPVLDRVARKPDGSYRVLASRLLPGKILGGFKYYGTRSDDPNDVIPHEHRRELRALGVFGAWTNLVDMKALNTMDTLLTENGQARVRHYLLDVGSTFGIGANGRREWWEGYEYLFEQDKMLKRMASFGFYLQPWQTVKYREYPAIGRFEGDEFNPDAWRSRVPAGAVLRARADDDFWAARRVMAFSDELIRALVKTGQYSDAKAEEYLGTVLIKRRNKIGQAYLSRVNPLVHFSLTSSDVLTFENAAVKTGVAKAPSSYVATWSEFNNSNGSTRPLGETKSSSEQITAPSGLPANEGSFVQAEVKAIGGPNPSWEKPVRVCFRRIDRGWKLVGLERMPDEPSRPPAPPEPKKVATAKK